jgi:hypothetical protein
MYAAPNCHKDNRFNGIKNVLYQEWRHHPVPSGNYTNQLQVSWGAKFKFLSNVNLALPLKPKSFRLFLWTTKIVSWLIGPIWSPRFWTFNTASIFLSRLGNIEFWHSSQQLSSKCMDFMIATLGAIYYFWQCKSYGSLKERAILRNPDVWLCGWIISRVKPGSLEVVAVLVCDWWER